MGHPLDTQTNLDDPDPGPYEMSDDEEMKEVSVPNQAATNTWKRYMEEAISGLENRGNRIPPGPLSVVDSSSPVLKEERPDQPHHVYDNGGRTEGVSNSGQTSMPKRKGRPPKPKDSLSGKYVSRLRFH